MQGQAAAAVVLLLTGLACAAAQPNGYYNVAPPGQAPVPVATGNDYAPTPAGASIILRTDLVLRLTTSQDFAGQSQTNFATAIRSLLAPYDFMSVAVSGFSTGSGYVDVTTRLVDFPSDAGTLAGIWYNIAQQLVANQTLLPSLQSLLGAFNVSTNVTLQSVLGSPDPSQPTVTLAVNLTVAEAQSQFQASTAVQPIATFLGDHAVNVTLSSTTPTGNNQVVATVQIAGMAPDQIPQLMAFLANSSGLSSSVPVTTTGYQVMAETPAPTTPSPPPASQPVPAPPPTASATPSPVPATPGNPNVDLDVSMRIFGSQMVPLTATNQFVAASALAGVFSIVIGVGTVQILSAAAAPPGSLPTTAAASGARKLLSLHEPQMPIVHVSRVLQQAAPTPGQAPAVDVLFSVSLPTASQNSLLVVQSSSAVVRAQFAGWFVYAMSGQGYNVNAEIMNITAQSASAPAAAPVRSSGGSSNAGAIAGGVVGGLAALALIALVAFFVLRNNRKNKGRAPVRSVPSVTGSEQKLMRSSDLDNGHGKGLKDSTFTMDMLHTPAGSEEIYTVGSPGFPSTPSRSATHTGSDNAQSLDARSKASSAGYSSGGVSDIDRLAHRRTRRRQALSTGSSSDASMQSLLSSLEALRPGSLFMERYLVERGARRGSHTALIYGQDKQNPSTEVVIKFFPGDSQARFTREKLYFDNRAALEPDTLGLHVEALLGSFSAHRSVLTEESVPPSLILERGAYTLHEWLGGVAKLAGRPEDAERIKAVHQLCCAVDYLHQRRLVHRGLTPRAVMHFEKDNKWKLTSMASWARAGDACHMESYDIRYAAPELLAADLRGDEEIVASEAADLWAVGAMAYEILCGRTLFPPSMDDHAVVGALLQLEGYKLPWELEAHYFEATLSPAACSLVQDLLVRAPNGRKPLRTALHSPLFQNLQA